MFPLLADENFNNDIVRGLLRVPPELDIITVQEAGLTAVKDPDLLAWAFQHQRVLVTHDVKSMRDHVESRVVQGLGVYGVIAVPRRLPIGLAINELRLCIECGTQEDWADQMTWVPL
jgi:hypothetical protein